MDDKRIAPWFAAVIAWFDNLGDALFGWLSGSLVANIRNLFGGHEE